MAVKAPPLLSVTVCGWLACVAVGGRRRPASAPAQAGAGARRGCS
jgi:hypothetical protein